MPMRLTCRKGMEVMSVVTEDIQEHWRIVQPFFQFGMIANTTWLLSG